MPQAVSQQGPIHPAQDNNQLRHTLCQVEHGVSWLQVEVQWLRGDFSERAQQRRWRHFGGEGGGAVPRSAGHPARTWPSASCVCGSGS